MHIWNKCENILISIHHFYFDYVKAVKYIVLYLCLLYDVNFFCIKSRVCNLVIHLVAG